MTGSTYTVTRDIDISATPDAIHEQLTDFRHWPNWSPWESLDPELERTYSGAEAGVGAVYEWSGNRRAGQGCMTIVRDSPTHVGIDLQFFKPFRSRTDCEFSLERQGDSTHVIWTMTGPMTFATRLIGIFKSMDSLIGPDFEKGLAQLRSLVEQSK